MNSSEKHHQLLKLLLTEKEVSVGDIIDKLYTTRRQIPRITNKLINDGYPLRSKWKGQRKYFYLPEGSTILFQAYLTIDEAKRLIDILNNFDKKTLSEKLLKNFKYSTI